ncbi:MAG: RNA polymerase sigma factor [Candidatus Rifleibacteriota bacterium]
MNTNSEIIWKKAVRGDQQAWQQLYQMFSAAVYQFFLKNTQNPELSMDKVQEVFIKVYRKRESFTYGSLKTWIFRIAKNLLIDEWRKKGKAELASEHVADVVVADDNVEEHVLKELEHQSMKLLIDQGLEKLKSPERMVVCLVYLAGLSIFELSQVMEIPLGTAKTRVRQARLKLDKIIREQLELKSLEKSL